MEYRDQSRHTAARHQNPTLTCKLRCAAWRQLFILFADLLRLHDTPQERKAPTLILVRSLKKDKHPSFDERSHELVFFAEDNFRQTGVEGSAIIYMFVVTEATTCLLMVNADEYD